MSATVHEQLAALRQMTERLAAGFEQPLAPPGGLLLSAADCRAIEETTGFGTTRSPAALRAAVERLATIAIGDIRLAFTPGQLEEIAHRAGKRGRTIEQEMKAVVDRIEDELFHRGG